MANDISQRRFPQYMLIGLYLIISSAIVFFGYRTYRDEAREIRKEVAARLSAIADTKASGLAQWRYERTSDMQILTGNTVFTGLARRVFDDPGNTVLRKRLENWLALYQELRGYKLVFLLDAQGVQRLASPADALLNCPKFESEAPAVFQTGKPVFIDFHAHAPDGDIHLEFAAPLFDRDTPLGIVVFVIDADTYLYPMIQRWPTPSRSAETLILRRDGDHVLFLNKLRFNDESALRLRIPLTQTNMPAVRGALGEQGVFEGVDYHGVPVIADVRRVPGLPWTMVARIDREEVYAPIRERAKVLIFQVFFLLSFFGFILALYLRQQRLSTIRHRALRHILFAQSLTRLMHSSGPVSNSLYQTLRSITAMAAHAMEIRRVSIWRYSDDYGRIRCLDLFDAEQDRHEYGRVLQSSAFTPYTPAHTPENATAIRDVFHELRNSRMPEQYFLSADIRSVLDVPVWHHGRLTALLCFEQGGKKRKWEPEEEQFARALAAYVGNCLEADERVQMQEMSNRGIVEE